LTRIAGPRAAGSQGVLRAYRERVFCDSTLQRVPWTAEGQRLRRREQLSRPVDRVSRVLSVRPGGPHGDLDVAVAVPGYLGHAQLLVEGLCVVVDGEHVQDQGFAVLPGLVEEGADQTGADAVTLMIGVDLDAGQVDLVRAVLDVEHADGCPAGGDDLPSTGVEGAGVVLTLDVLVPSQVAVT